MQAQAWAAGLITVSSLESIDRHLAALTDTARLSPARRNEIVEQYAELFMQRHAHITLPDTSRRVEVEWQDIFLPPRLAWSTENLLPTTPDTRTLSGRLGGRWDLEFSELAGSVDRTVILDDPGTGKSTATLILALDWMRAKRGLAFYIRMREVEIDGHGFNLVSVLRSLLASRYQLGELDQGSVASLLTEPDTLLVFDGLDEVISPSRRTIAGKGIQMIASRYPFARIVVTSRKIGYAAVRIPNAEFNEYVLDPFTSDQAESYMRKWFTWISRDDPKTVDRATKDLMRRSNGIVELCSNPLLLALICMIYRGIKTVPRSRPEIYRRCLDLLLYERDVSVGLSEYPQHLDQYRYALSEIAYASFVDPNLRRQLTETAVLRIATDTLANVVPTLIMAQELARELIEHCRGRAWIFTDSGLDPFGADLFTFTHDCFREYLTAVRIVRFSADAEEIAQQIVTVAGSGPSSSRSTAPRRAGEQAPPAVVTVLPPSARSIRKKSS